jgi:hypothetical protein
MISNGDGTFSPQHILQLTGDSSISLPVKYSYGNGLGDFDNDGDLDYIMGMGYGSGNITSLKIRKLRVGLPFWTSGLCSCLG